jgi:alkanesulfonate monooxygenase SsuD/methylene tetrahydromethanopterin reductase-like flavin-dependent oxidoreductase (luciferase family)
MIGVGLDSRLGPQMLRLAGETADGALLSWATPERMAVSRVRIDEGAARAARAPGSVPALIRSWL